MIPNKNRLDSLQFNRSSPYQYDSLVLNVAYIANAKHTTGGVSTYTTCI